MRKNTLFVPPVCQYGLKPLEKKMLNICHPLFYIFGILKGEQHL